MSKLVLVARILLGLAFLVFGLNGFFHFFAPPPPAPGPAADFGGALAASGYMFPLMSLFEVIAAVLLIVNRAVPFALLLLAPILVNIVAFHVALDPGGLGAGLFLTVLEAFLAWAVRDAWRGLFVPATGK